jgi:hypothetical protein
MVGHCGSGEPWKAVVAGTISTESGEGRGWSSHWRGREAKGRKGARERWSGATACKGKGKGAQGMAALAKGGWCWGEKGRGGPVLGAPRGGGAGGPSRARHVTRWREGHQRHAPGAAVLGRARGSRGGLGHRHVGAAAQYQIVVNFIQTQISNGI